MLQICELLNTLHNSIENKTQSDLIRHCFYSKCLENLISEIRVKLPITASRFFVGSKNIFTCTGCIHNGQWEDELELGVPCPCTYCSRRYKIDNYEAKL